MHKIIKKTKNKKISIQSKKQSKKQSNKSMKIKPGFKSLASMILYKNKKLLNKSETETSDPSFKPLYYCNYSEYHNLLKDEYNYRKYYKDYDSDVQIKTIVSLSIKFDPNFLTRLLLLLLKRFNSILTGEILKILRSNKNDSEIYYILKKMYKNKKNIIKPKSSLTCGKNRYIADLLNVRTTRIFNSPPKNYLDIGTGNGNFAVTLGRKLKLDKDHIFGCDLENFSEQGDWGRDVNKNNFTFVKLKENQKYPFEDNTFDIITMKMVLHHVDNVDFLMSEITRILTPNGVLIIIEHDSFTFVDYMLNDIEHGLYVNVFNDDYDDSFSNEDYKFRTQNIEKKKYIDVVRYYDWLELDYIINKHNFTYKWGDVLSEHINMNIQSTRSFYFIYQKKN